MDRTTGNHARYDHVAFCAPNKTVVRDFLIELFGGTVTWDSWQESSEFRGTQFMVGDTKVEIIEPTADKGFAVDFLEKRGPGLHHLTWEVDDLDGLVEDLQAKNVRLAGLTRKDGKVSNVFISPKSAFGVLIQFNPVRTPEENAQIWKQEAVTLPAPQPSRGHVKFIAIAARNEEPVSFFHSVLGGEPQPVIHKEGLIARPLRREGPSLTFFWPDGEGMPTKFLDTRGPGMHHVGFEVDSVEDVAETAQRLGCRTFSDGTSTFIHPANPSGALIRLWPKNYQG